MKMCGKSKLATMSIISLLMFHSCSFSKKVSDPEEKLYASDWVLYNLKGSNISLDYFAEGAPNIKFDPDGNIRIFTGCNTISGKFSISGSFLNLDFVSDSGTCSGVLENDFINSL